MANMPVNINFNISTPDAAAFKRSQAQVSSVFTGNIHPPRPPIPKHIIDEQAEYRKLLYLYQDRFEKWPDAKIRDILFKQAIKFVAEVAG